MNRVCPQRGCGWEDALCAFRLHRALSLSAMGYCESGNARWCRETHGAESWETASCKRSLRSLGLAWYSGKPSKEPIFQKTRLSHQQTGACGLEVASSALCPILAVLGEAGPKRGAQLAESTWDFLEQLGGRFHHCGPKIGHLHGSACSLPREDD